MENQSTLKLTIPNDKVKLVLDLINSLSANLKFPISLKQESKEKEESFSILKYAGAFDGEFGNTSIRDIKANKVNDL